MSDFQLGKLWLVDMLAMSKDALHIFVGLTVFLVSAALLRRPLRDWRPVLAVLLVALAGEGWDLLETWQAGQVLRWSRSGHDVFITCFWPVVLFAIARRTSLMRR